MICEDGRKSLIYLKRKTVDIKLLEDDIISIFSGPMVWCTVIHNLNGISSEDAALFLILFW
jgi:hypothetical protein